LKELTSWRLLKDMMLTAFKRNRLLYTHFLKKTWKKKRADIYEKKEAISQYQIIAIKFTWSRVL
jgi:hypothetical protein